MLLLNMLVAGLLVAITFSVHLAGLVGLTAVFRRAAHGETSRRAALREGVSILAVVFGLFVLHSAEIWIYAAAFLALGEFSAVEPALYFSVSSFTTVGYGDVILSDEWRLLGAIEGANGFLLIGWSTAFLVSLTGRLRALEAGIERGGA